MSEEEAIHYLELMLKSKHKETYVYADEAIKVLLRKAKVIGEVLNILEEKNEEEEQYKVRIKELEKIIEDWRTHFKYIQIDLNESIPKQKIQDKIDEINKAYEDSKNERGETEFYYPNYTIGILQELLEDKESEVQK